MGPVLVVVGLLVTAAGVLVWLGVPLGRLPGDIVVDRPNVRFYFPITTSILASGLFTIVSWLLRR